MEDFLFVDNIRGFSQTFIPLQKVNFLVGENSTGKTTVMALITLLASPNFWMSPTFNTGDIQFGLFDDIVSKNSEYRSRFTLGTIRFQDMRLAGLFLFKFKPSDGLPIVSSCCYFDGKYLIQVDIGKRDISYSVEDAGSEHTESSIIEFCSRWAKTDDNLGENMDKISGIKEPIPILFIPDVVDHYRAKKLKIKAEHGTRKVLARGIIPSQSTVLWLAPIRTKPQKTYADYTLEFSPDGAHTPYLIKKMFKAKTRGKSFKDRLISIGIDTGLFDSISIRPYGKGNFAPFELDVHIKGKPHSISNVGYGVSQSLPVISELLAAPKNSRFAIQQPEVHLHPRAQAALGELFYELSAKEEKNFLIETHSDFIINRFLLALKNGNKKPKSQVLFFQYIEGGNSVFPLPVSESGELPEEQPSNYRDFFLDEELKILEL